MSKTFTMYTLRSGIPFIEAVHLGGKQKPKSVLIRLSETTSVPGAALGIANNWHRNESFHDSCHYVLDRSFVFQCVPENRVAFSTPYTSNGTISINVCAQPLFDVEFWKDPDYAAMLHRTAELTAKICGQYNIPVRDIGVEQHRGWFRKGGVITAVKGAWPGEQFLEAVRILKP